jgi:hypothetical protein
MQTDKFFGRQETEFIERFLEVGSGLNGIVFISL